MPTTRFTTWTARTWTEGGSGSSWPVTPGTVATGTGPGTGGAGGTAVGRGGDIAVAPGTGGETAETGTEQKLAEARKI